MRRLLHGDRFGFKILYWYLYVMMVLNSVVKYEKNVAGSLPIRENIIGLS